MQIETSGSTLFIWPKGIWVFFLSRMGELAYSPGRRPEGVALGENT